MPTASRSRAAAPAVSPEAWIAAFGLIGTLGGAALGLLGGIWIERVKISDAKAARDQARQERQGELQRATLIEFQEVLGPYVRTLGKINLENRRLQAEGTLTAPARLLPEGLSEAAFEESRRLRQLALRIRDDDLRECWEKFFRAAADIEIPQIKTPQERFNTAVLRQHELEDRLGEVLRPLL